MEKGGKLTAMSEWMREYLSLKWNETSSSV